MHVQLARHADLLKGWPVLCRSYGLQYRIIQEFTAGLKQHIRVYPAENIPPARQLSAVAWVCELYRAIIGISWIPR